MQNLRGSGRVGLVGNKVHYGKCKVACIERCPVILGDKRAGVGKNVLNCNQFTHAALRSSYELSFKRLCVPDRIGIWK